MLSKTLYSFERKDNSPYIHSTNFSGLLLL